MEYLVDLISSYGVWSHFGAILGRFWGYLGLVLSGAGGPNTLGKRAKRSENACFLLLGGKHPRENAYFELLGGFPEVKPLDTTRILSFLEVSWSKKPRENACFGLLGGQNPRENAHLGLLWRYLGAESLGRTCFRGFLELSWSILAIFSRLTASWSRFGGMLKRAFGASWSCLGVSR